jgi:TonB-linked SusC/RagA family outer membrane protein
MKKFFLFLLIFQASWTLTAHGQDKVVAGQVTDTTGPVIGASIIEKGLPTNGTTSDQDGNFRLSLRGTSNTIIVSTTGHITREVNLQGRSYVSVNMVSRGATAMNEVVVVGFGRQKKVTMTGAVSSVNGKELRENPSASLQNTLSGRLPGFFSQQTSGRPGADGATFYIRGQSSYNVGSNQPLIIVDDIEFTYDQFARIDPNEIESLSILKDASTTAIYGVKGANGVVIVTTRRGRTGAPQISVRTETSLMQPAKIPHYLGSYETALLYNQAMLNDYRANPPGNPPGSIPFVPRFSDRDLELYRDGTDPYGHPDINWREVLFKKFSRQYRANFDISGGSERVKYFVSLGYLMQDGILKNFSKASDINSNYFHNRYNYRSNLDIKVTKSTDLRLDLYGNIGQVNTPNVGSPFGYNDVFYEYSSFYSLAPWAYPLYNPDGTYGYSQWQRSTGGGNNYNTNNIIGRLSHYGYNRSNENNINLITTATQKLDFLAKGLSLKGTLSYASTYGYSRSMTRDQFPSFIYNPDTKGYEPRDANVYRMRRLFIGYNPGSTIRRVNVQAILNYDRTFKSHRVYALGLVNQSSVMQFSSNSAYNFIPNNFRGFTGRIGYSYKEKYLFEMNSAYNGSDLFAEENRYGFFPAVSAGWNISEEKFFANTFKFIDRLKLRGSYGLVGNDRIGGGFNYYYQQTYSGSSGYSFGIQHNQYGGIIEGRLPNEEVTWEKENKLDLGIDFGLFGNKLSGAIDYFDNNRYDILTSRGTVSAVFGQALPPVNLGRVNNHGYEIELNYNSSIGKEFTYRLKGTYSVAKNKILYQDEPSQLYDYQSFTGNSIGQQRVYIWTGSFYKDSADIANSPRTVSPAYPGDLKYADMNKDNLINQYDMVVTGYSNVPNTTYGFQVGFSFKGFSLSTFFQGAKNFNVRAVAEAIRPFSSNMMEVHKRAWTPELGDNAAFPRLSFNPGVSDALSNPSTFWFLPGDYLRLKTAELAYSLPKKLVDRMKVRSIRVYTNGYNLLTWTKLSKLYELDPEINTNSDRVIYPPQRIFNFGLNVTF